ncbi:MAG: GNAT family N-acetyltransferase [Burkholderiales bacterium]|nr:GNAT family N-acetyltransferase [Burkholderiales bacterium]
MILLRPARLSDASNLAALGMQVWLHTYATQGLRDTIADYVLNTFTEQRCRQRIADAQQSLVVAERNAHLVAYAALDFSTTHPSVPAAATELATLYVQAHFSGQAIGTRLLDACAELALERTGSAQLWLTVNSQNSRARHFYAKHGYTQCGTSYFEFGGERHENLVMCRPATPRKDKASE